jgi:hypothetical protein
LTGVAAPPERASVAVFPVEIEGRDVLVQLPSPLPLST